MAYGGTRSRLSRLAGVPVLIVHGTADRLVPVANATVLHEALPHARLAVVEGAGHVFWTDRPQDAARVLLSFLDEQDAADAPS